MQSSITCPEAQQLPALLDESLPVPEIERLTVHIGECVHCQVTLERLAAGGSRLTQVVSASARDTPAPDSAYWMALASLEQIVTRSTPTPTQTTPMDPASRDPRSTAFLEPPTEPGQLGRLGHFAVKRVIGQGGMGVVLHAHDEQLQREVAIKVLDPRLASDENARQRFCREARAAAAVSDDHIVAVHSVASEGEKDLPYFVMQLVEGESLEQRLGRVQRLSTDEIIQISMQVAGGLAAAHDRGLIHRDIKPGNVLLEKGTDRVKITDFGLARAAEDLRLTRSGMVAGTPLYMAPEQARGEPFDHRADLFSLGVVMYEMATGAPPFVGTTPLAVLKRLSDEPHRPISELNPSLPDWLVELIDHLLQKRPDDRPQSAREVAKLLEDHWMLLRTSSSEHAVCPRARARRKMIQLTAVGVVGGVLLTLAGLGVFRLLRPALPEPVKPWAVLGDNRGPVWSVANSPDGRLIAIGTESDGVKLWNPQDDRLEATLPERRPVRRVSFSGDGRRLAVASEDATVRVYDITTQRAILSLEHPSGVHAVAMSRDGTRLVSGTRTGQVLLWDLETGKPLFLKEAHRTVYSVVWSPDDREYASTGEDGRVMVWDPVSGQPRLTIPNHGGSVWSLAFSPDGKLLATGGWDGVVRLWETGKGKLQSELRARKTEDEQDIWSLSFCPSGRVLATGSADGSIRLWSVTAEQERALLMGHYRAVYTVAIFADGKNLVSGSRDGTARVWAIPPICKE